jgi:hypothetical protein
VPTINHVHPLLTPEQTECVFRVLTSVGRRGAQ